MRIEELKGKTNEEQSKLIAECPRCKMDKALDNPKVLEKRLRYSKVTMMDLLQIGFVHEL